jgi:hypothetical protein
MLNPEKQPAFPFMSTDQKVYIVIEVNHMESTVHPDLICTQVGDVFETRADAEAYIDFVEKQTQLHNKKAKECMICRHRINNIKPMKEDIPACYEPEGSGAQRYNCLCCRMLPEPEYCIEECRIKTKR